MRSREDTFYLVYFKDHFQATAKPVFGYTMEKAVNSYLEWAMKEPNLPKCRYVIAGDPQKKLTKFEVHCEFEPKYIAVEVHE